MNFLSWMGMFFIFYLTIRIIVWWQEFLGRVRTLEWKVKLLDKDNK